MVDDIDGAFELDERPGDTMLFGKHPSACFDRRPRAGAIEHHRMAGCEEIGPEGTHGFIRGGAGQCTVNAGA
jgi:hypothetical protein